MRPSSSPHLQSPCVASRSADARPEVRRRARRQRPLRQAVIQPERSVLAQVDEITQNEIHVARLPVRSKAHHLVFTGIHLEAGVIGEGRVQQAERIWPSELRENFQIAPPAQADRCGSPFTDSVHRQDGGFLKRRWKERARCVGFVMLRIEKRPFVPAKRFTKQAIGEKLLLYPERAGLEKGSKAPRRDR